MIRHNETANIDATDTDESTSRIKAGRPKNLKKRQQILTAASELFLQQGFSASSMDNVAQSAGVSKQTVYSHFANKEALFTAVIQHKVDEYQLDGETTGCQKLPLNDRLTNIATRFVKLLQDSEVNAMYRVVIGEINTAPRAAELFYEAGPQHSFDMLYYLFKEAGFTRLTQHESQRIAVEFFNLLKGEYHMRAMLGLDYAMTAEQEEDLIQRSVKHVMSQL
ncbi:TetR/AcrR family transcriptional regulator [Alteromonadaceae bacterium M269]|nr:TetR/AcrR family transcriptional regulator [Alteromonadaceae bacterium M269]